MAQPINTFSKNNFHELCDMLAASDADLAYIKETYGYPPFWNRQNTYETFMHIILEQQVSLASAKAALEKLRIKVTYITPEIVVGLTDAEFRDAYFSRQKTAYIKHLAEQILNKHINISALAALSDDEIRKTLIQLKGVGNWTIDVYLLMVLHRTDFFPLGDIGAKNALKRLKKLPKEAAPEELQKIVETWKPYRSIGTMLLWHYYLSSRLEKRNFR